MGYIFELFDFMEHIAGMNFWPAVYDRGIKFPIGFYVPLKIND